MPYTHTCKCNSNCLAEEPYHDFRTGQGFSVSEMCRILYQVRNGDKSVRHMAWEVYRDPIEVEVMIEEADKNKWFTM